MDMANYGQKMARMGLLGMSNSADLEAQRNRAQVKLNQVRAIDQGQGMGALAGMAMRGLQGKYEDRQQAFDAAHAGDASKPDFSALDDIYNHFGDWLPGAGQAGSNLPGGDTGSGIASGGVSSGGRFNQLAQGPGGGSGIASAEVSSGGRFSQLAGSGGAAGKPVAAAGAGLDSAGDFLAGLFS